MSQKTNKEKFKLIFNYLSTLIKEPKCELHYSKDYELLIAVLLSAQCRDVAVNKVTEVLFEKYTDLHSIAEANLTDIEKIIHPLGMYKIKAKNILLLSKELISKYNGQVINDKNILESLPGVGHKTCSVVRGELFNEYELPVDTHIKRLSIRFGFVKDNSDPLKIENVLKSIIDKKYWMKTHHLLIHFGRYYCKANNPKCGACKIKDICVYFKKNI